MNDEKLYSPSGRAATETPHALGPPRSSGRRRVRMTREPGQSLVLSSLAGALHPPVEIRISQVCAGGVAVLDVLLPDHMFVERKETLDGVHALFACRPAPQPDTVD